DWGGLEEAILPVLNRQPELADRDKFLRGLASPQLSTIGLCLDALDKLPPIKDAADILVLVRCLRCLPDGKEADRLRVRLGRHLERLAATNFGNDKLARTQCFL